MLSALSVFSDILTVTYIWHTWYLTNHSTIQISKSENLKLNSENRTFLQDMTHKKNTSYNTAVWLLFYAQETCFKQYTYRVVPEIGTVPKYTIVSLTATFYLHFLETWYRFPRRTTKITWLGYTVTWGEACIFLEIHPISINFCYDARVVRYDSSIKVKVKIYSLVSSAKRHSPAFTQLPPGHRTCSFISHLNSPGSIQLGCHSQRTKLLKHTNLHCPTRSPLTLGSRECTCEQSALPRSKTSEHIQRSGESNPWSLACTSRTLPLSHDAPPNNSRNPQNHPWISDNSNQSDGLVFQPPSPSPTPPPWALLRLDKGLDARDAPTHLLPIRKGTGKPKHKWRVLKNFSEEFSHDLATLFWKIHVHTRAHTCIQTHTHTHHSPLQLFQVYGLKQKEWCRKFRVTRGEGKHFVNQYPAGEDNDRPTDSIFCACMSLTKDQTAVKVSFWQG